MHEEIEFTTINVASQKSNHFLLPDMSTERLQNNRTKCNSKERGVVIKQV